jgi:hypothetical protein
MAARLRVLRSGPAPARRSGLTWPRLPANAELAIIGAGYAGYALVRLAIRAGRAAAFAHAAQLWGAERRLHLTVEPFLNHLTAAHLMLADAAGYYYGLLHFLVTPLVLAWLYLCRRAVFPQLRSALMLATAIANVVFWAWPAAPPRFSVPGMTDTLAAQDILGAAHPHGAASLVNLYAAMPSLHVAWAVWCAAAIGTAARTRWRRLAWLYPVTTTLVVLASANHFLLDAAGGVAVTGLGMLAAGRPGQLPVAGPAPAGSSRLAITFPRVRPGRRKPVQPRLAGELWMAVNGLCAAATVGLYALAGCSMGSSASARGPAPATAREERR